MTASLILRERTADAHARVDALFGGYDLADAHSYRRFLLAHARALPGAEALLLAQPGLPRFEPRASALAADLAALGAAMPPVTTLAAIDAPMAWGLLYTIEGSRLGGTMLARRVPEEWPRAYLSAAHGPGGWRALRAAIDAEGERHGAAWIDAAVAGALAGFALYEKAV